MLEPWLVRCVGPRRIRCSQLKQLTSPALHCERRFCVILSGSGSRRPILTSFCRFMRRNMVGTLMPWFVRCVWPRRIRWSQPQQLAVPDSCSEWWICVILSDWFGTPDFNTFLSTYASKYGRYARAMACQMRRTEADTMFTIETTNKSSFALREAILCNFEWIWFETADFDIFLPIYASKYGRYAHAMVCQMRLT